MRIHMMEDYDELSHKAASIIASQVVLKPDSVLGMATGSSPLGMYQCLVKMFREGLLDFSEVKAFNLDEYIGLASDHPQSYHYYMYNNFFNHINVKPENINLPPGNPVDPGQACRDYDARINDAGGIDLQLAGIGINGHIGFNEPDQKLKTDTHIVELTKDTIAANSRFFTTKDQVPRRAISMGMRSIMQARRILILANGKSKAKAVKGLVSNGITTELPASLLQLHPEVILILDQGAAAAL